MVGLRNILASDVLERRTVVSSLCNRAAYRRSSCNLCAQSCPTGTLTFKDDLPFVGPACSECGTCVASCPNGVFLPKTNRDAGVLKPLLDQIRNHGLRTVIYRCERAVKMNNQETAAFDCLGRITESLIVGPLIFGAERVTLLRGECDKCGNSKTLSSQQRTIEVSRVLAKAMLIEPHRITVARKLDCELIGKDATASLGRRNFLGMLKSNLAAVAGEVVVATKPAVRKNGRLAHPDNWKRNQLLLLLSAAQCVSEEEISSELLPAAEISVGPECVGCRLCSAVCPAKAIRIPENAKTFEFQFSPHLCTACRNCETACRFNAIACNTYFHIKNLFSQERVTLLQAAWKTCRSCGATFIHSKEPICRLCQKNSSQAI